MPKEVLSTAHEQLKKAKSCLFTRLKASMKKIVRRENVFPALALLLVVWMAQFAYRKNNICSLEDHPIQSEADAIAVVKRNRQR